MSNMIFLKENEQIRQREGHTHVVIKFEYYIKRGNYYLCNTVEGGLPDDYIAKVRAEIDTGCLEPQNKDLPTLYGYLCAGVNHMLDDIFKDWHHRRWNQKKAQAFIDANVIRFLRVAIYRDYIQEIIDGKLQKKAA